MAAAPINACENYRRPKPNHMIFWLDRDIGNPAEYVHLKKAFAETANPCWGNYTFIDDVNLDNFLPWNPIRVVFNDADFVLQTFDSIETCLRAFERYQDMRIFFLVSESMGEIIIPQIMESYQHVFTDPVTHKPYSSIYVFRHYTELSNDAKISIDTLSFEGIDQLGPGSLDSEIIIPPSSWMMDHINYILMFDFDKDMLARLTLDIAEYYIVQGQRSCQNNDPKKALTYFYWAEELWYRHDRINFCDSYGRRERMIFITTSQKLHYLICELEAVLLDHDMSNSHLNINEASTAPLRFENNGEKTIDLLT